MFGELLWWDFCYLSTIKYPINQYIQQFLLSHNFYVVFLLTSCGRFMTQFIGRIESYGNDTITLKTFHFHHQHVYLNQQLSIDNLEMQANNNLRLFIFSFCSVFFFGTKEDPRDDFGKWLLVICPIYLFLVVCLVISNLDS